MSEITKEKVIASYSVAGVTARSAAKALGISARRLKELMVTYGIPPKRRVSRFPLLANKDWLEHAYIKEKKSVRQIAKESGATTGAVHSALTWAHIPLRSVKDGLKEAFPNGRAGEIHPSWGGGRKIIDRRTKSEKIKSALKMAFPNGRNGELSPRWGGGSFNAGSGGAYVYIWSKGHPHANKQGYVMEHRLVMEQMLGRYLTQEEIVHHRNGKKDDNRPENLELTRRGDHTRKHFEDSFKISELEKDLAEYRRRFGPLDNSSST